MEKIKQNETEFESNFDFTLNFEKQMQTHVQDCEFAVRRRKSKQIDEMPKTGSRIGNFEFCIV